MRRDRGLDIAAYIERRWAASCTLSALFRMLRRMGLPWRTTRPVHPQAGAEALEALLPLPPYSPEFNPVERVWLYLRERCLSFRLHRSEQAIVDALCAAWNALRDETGRFTTLTSCPWITQAIDQISE